MIQFSLIKSIYKLRTINKNQLTSSEEEILSLLRAIPSDTISFSQQWAFRLLQLFGTKQEINLFWTFFSQILLKRAIRSDKDCNNYQIDLQQEVMSALAQHNEQQYQNKLKYNGQQMGKSITSQWTGLSDLALDAEDFTQNFSINQQDLSYLQKSKSQYSGSQVMSQKESINSMDEEMNGPGILPKALREQLRKEFEYYRDSQRQFINITQIAKKYCISEIALGRLIKKWSFQPQFTEYLNKIQQKQQLWHIKTPYFKQIQTWGKKIEQILYKNPYLNFTEIGEQLRLHGKYKIPEEAVLKKIMSEMKYVRKRVGSNEIGKNTNENMFIRKKYCQIYQNLMKKKQIAVFFLDEYRFDNEAHPEHGWVKVGQYLPPLVKTTNSYVSLIVLLSQNFSFNFKTFINQGNPEPNLGPTLHKLIQQVVNKIKQKQVIVITTCPQMNNAPNNTNIKKQSKEFSMANVAKQAISRNGWNMMILPPKSSELNPLVSFFKQIRDQMKRLAIKCSNLNELEQKLKQICPTLEYFQPNFEQVKKYASKGVLGYKF